MNKILHQEKGDYACDCGTRVLFPCDMLEFICPFCGTKYIEPAWANRIRESSGEDKIESI